MSKLWGMIVTPASLRSDFPHHRRTDSSPGAGIGPSHRRITHLDNLATNAKRGTAPTIPAHLGRLWIERRFCFEKPLSFTNRKMAVLPTRARETLDLVLAYRLHLGWCGPNAFGSDCELACPTHCRFGVARTRTAPRREPQAAEPRLRLGCAWEVHTTLALKMLSRVLQKVVQAGNLTCSEVCYLCCIMVYRGRVR
jgi:hypothetical protein